MDEHMTIFKKLFLFIFFMHVSALSAGGSKHDTFLIHIIPKCGTHLTMKTFELLLGYRPLYTELTTQAIFKTLEMKNGLRSSGKYDSGMENFFAANGIKLMSVYRDPRDALISHLFYMRSYFNKGLKRDFFVVCSDFDYLSFDEQLSALITGRNEMISYLDFYMDQIAWTFSPLTLGVKYEDLVGKQGGGDDKKQSKAIKSIANHIGFKLTSKKLNHVVKNMYNKSPDQVQDDKTFVRASIGNWKTFFKPEHTALFKEKTDDLVVKLGYEKDQNW